MIYTSFPAITCLWTILPWCEHGGLNYVIWLSRVVLRCQLRPWLVIILLEVDSDQPTFADLVAQSVNSQQVRVWMRGNDFSTGSPEPWDAFRPAVEHLWWRPPPTACGPIPAWPRHRPCRPCPCPGCSCGHCTRPTRPSKPKQTNKWLIAGRAMGQLGPQRLSQPIPAQRMIHSLCSPTVKAAEAQERNTVKQWKRVCRRAKWRKWSKWEESELMGNVLAEDGRSWGQDWAARFGCCGEWCELLSSWGFELKHLMNHIDDIINNIIPNSSSSVSFFHPSCLPQSPSLPRAVRTAATTKEWWNELLAVTRKSRAGTLDHLLKSDQPLTALFWHPISYLKKTWNCEAQPCCLPVEPRSLL